MPTDEREKKVVSVHWFRQDLRLHDNPALLASIRGCDKFIAVFINDGVTAGLSNAGYNKGKFLTQALQDLDDQLRDAGGYLHILKGQPCDIFRALHAEVGINRISFEQNCETIWKVRDEAVRKVANELGINILEEVSHTLWNPQDVLAANGDIPPLTYEMFVQVTSCLGEPDHPAPNPEWDNVLFTEITDDVASALQVYNRVPTPAQLGCYPEGGEEIQYKGGETHALRLLKQKLKMEEEAFMDFFSSPKMTNQNLLSQSMSMTAAITFGCLSVRKFYWDIQDVNSKLYGDILPPNHNLTEDLIWREFSICMSIDTPTVSPDITMSSRLGDENNRHHKTQHMKLPFKKCKRLVNRKFKYQHECSRKIQQDIEAKAYEPHQYISLSLSCFNNVL